MQVKVENKCGREYVKRAMLSTMAVTSLSNPDKFNEIMSKPLSDKVFRTMLVVLSIQMNSLGLEKNLRIGGVCDGGIHVS